MNDQVKILILVGLAALAVRQSGCPAISPVAPGAKMVVMLYEAEHGPLPGHAAGAAHELVAAGAEVRMVDDDILDGTGETPEWLKPALEPGRAVMGASQLDDALVVLQGNAVVKAVKLPETKELIVEASK